MFRFILIWVLSASLYGSGGFDYLEKASFKDDGSVEVSCLKQTKRWKQVVDFNAFQRGDFCVKPRWVSSGFFKSKTTKNCYLNAEVIYSNKSVKELQISETDSCHKIKIVAGKYQCTQSKCTSLSGKRLELFANEMKFELTNGYEIFQFETTGKITVLGDSVIQMAFIPSGDFMVGSPKNEKGRDYSEGLRPVGITKPFLMQKYEASQKQWIQINKKEKLGYASCDEIKNGGDICSDYPISLVELKSIQDYINSLNKLKNPKKDCGNLHTDKGYAKARSTSGCFRLPTEAEWEYAARAGTQGSFGLPGEISESTAKDYMNVKSTVLMPVGSYPYSNLWGLYDMHGNVQEFVQDHYKVRYKALKNINRENDPLNFKVSAAEAKKSGFWKSHVVKGGDYYYGFDKARSASRVSYYSDSKRIRTGFRLARTL